MRKGNVPIMRHRRNKPDRSTTVAGRLLAITLSVGLLTGTVATAKAATSKPSGSDANATAALEGAKDTGSADPGVNKQSSGIASSNATSPDPSTKPTTPSAPTATPGTSETPSTTPTPQNSEQPAPSSDPAPTPTPTQSDPKDSDHSDKNSIQPRSSTAYTVIFKSPIGSTTPKQRLFSGDRVRRPADPYCKGYSFIGWFIGNVAYDFAQPLTGDLTLTAHWVQGLNSWSLSPSHGPTTGNTTATLTPPTVGDIRFSQFSAGKDFSLALDSAGVLYSWGNNSKGQLGRTPSASEPADRPGRVNVPDDVRFLQISAGDDYAVAIDMTNHLYSWGNNEKGQLGQGTSSTESRPPQQALPYTHAAKSFVQVSAGPSHVLATSSDGLVFSWGDNSSGQLGRAAGGVGSHYSTADPTVVELPKGVTITQVTAGGKTSLALAADGSVYSWGDNSSGQLGRTPSASEPADRAYKMSTADGVSFSKISAGYRHILAVDSDGNAYSWGYGSTTQPSKVVLPEGIKTRQVSAGHDYSLITGSDGNIYSWGDNSSGQLGQDTGGETTNQPGKAVTLDGGTYIQAIAGYRHILALGSDGFLYGWGDNSSSQLGTGAASSVPVTTPSKADYPQEAKFSSAKLDGTEITGLSKNQDGTWSFRTPAHKKGQVDVTVAWTRNGHQPDAHLLYKYDGSMYTVTFDSEGGTSTPDAQRVMDGDQAVRPDKDPAKDGYLFDGWFLKDSKGGSNIAYDFNQPVTGDITLVAHFSPVSHWSIDKKEGPETGDQSVKLTPLQDTRGIRFSWIQSGQTFSLAFGSDGNLYSWGSNEYGQLGRTPSELEPADRPFIVKTPAGVRYMQAAAGENFVLALGSDGYVYTWGDNYYKQLGRSTSSLSDNSPGKVELATGIRFTRVYAGDRFALALGSDDNLYAWGDDSGGALGQGTLRTSSDHPIRVAVPEGITFTQVFTEPSSRHVLALGSDSNLYSWGYNNGWQLGRDRSEVTKFGDPWPRKVYTPTGITFTQASPGHNFSLALGSDNNLYSWGSNNKDQLGNKEMLSQSPTKVIMPSGVNFTRCAAGWYFGLAAGSDGNIYSWGSNDYGQLGRTISGKSDYLPTKVDAPAGIALIQPQAGNAYSLAIGSDGNTYSWGDDRNNQLGRERPTSDKLDPHPGKVNFPGVGIPRLVHFGNAAGTNLTNNNDGTWNVTTPPYSPGPVTVTIDWTVNGVAQTPDTSNVYRYTSIGVLPRAGGTGIFLPLAIGVIIIATTIAARRLRQTRSLNR